MAKKKSKKNLFNKISIIVEWIISLLLILLIILTAFQRFSNQGNFFGYRIYTVASGSMIPTYDIGDTLLIKDTDISDLKVGDAVTYIGEADGLDGLIITHQIQKIELGEDGKLYFHTKGIANNIEDPIVDESQVLGKVVYKFIFLSIFGKITTNMTALLLFITVPVAILIAIEIIKIVYKQDEDEDSEEISKRIELERERKIMEIRNSEEVEDTSNKKISDVIAPSAIEEVISSGSKKKKQKNNKNNYISRRIARRNAYYNKQKTNNKNKNKAEKEKTIKIKWN